MTACFESRTIAPLLLIHWAVLICGVLVDELLPAASPIMVEIAHLHANDKIRKHSANTTSTDFAGGSILGDRRRHAAGKSHASKRRLPRRQHGADRGPRVLAKLGENLSRAVPGAFSPRRSSHRSVHKSPSVALHNDSQRGARPA